MADNNRSELVDTGAQQHLVEQGNGLVEKEKILRQHMADMYQAWMTGKAPPPPPHSFLDGTLIQTPVIVPNDPSYFSDAPAYHSFPITRVSYASLFQRLKQLDMLKMILIKMPNPLSKKFAVSQRCAYFSDSSGHGIENCWSLKKAIQKLIDVGDIVVQNPDVADTSQSPSPVHNETHLLECENSSGSLRGTSAAKLSALSEVDLKNEPVKGTKKQSVKNNVTKSCEVPSVIDAEPIG